MQVMCAFHAFLLWFSLKSGGTKYYGGKILPLQSCFKVKFHGDNSTAKHHQLCGSSIAKVIMW
jgi:hypothetical protein